MKILVACEESQVVTKEFRRLGHDAWSCDLQDCSGGHPEWHIKGDIRDQLTERYDIVIFHPVCRYIANSGVRWMHEQPGRWLKMLGGCGFFNLRHQFNSDYVATENPIPHKYAVNLIGKYDQLFQPWHFGHKKMKATCLWLKNLPPLQYTNIVGPPPKDKKQRYEWQDVWTCSPGPGREKMRSKTYIGIAKAMAEQWSNYVENNHEIICRE